MARPRRPSRPRRRPPGDGGSEAPVRFSRLVPGRGRGTFTLSGRGARAGLRLRADRANELTVELSAVRGAAREGPPSRRSRTLAWGGLEVRVDGAPPRLVVRGRNGARFEIAPELPAGKLAGPLPWSARGRGISFPFRIAPGERIYGLGEFFGPIDRVGQELRVSVRDVFGLPNDGTYVAYPFFWSDRGYTFLAETWAPVRFDFGRRYVGLGEVELPVAPVTIRLFFSRSPAEILRWFWSRRGHPEVPPLWSYGVWYSRCAYRNQAQLLRVARRVRRLGLPGDVIHLDPPWLDQPLPDALYRAGRRLGFARSEVDRRADRDPGDVLAGLAAEAARRGVALPFLGVGCTFRWNRSRFPDPAAMVRELHDRRFHLSLWVNPYLPAHTPEHRTLAARGLLLRRPDGRIGIDLDEPSSDFGAIDLSQPGGRAWLSARIRELVRQGVDVVKKDFGEAIPEDASGRGVPAPAMHNRFATLYPETVYRAMRTAGAEPIVWGRSGGLDVHRYPVQWGGDPRTFPRDMAAALRGALSYAASGGAFASFDSGGFGGRPTPELYVRWMQMGMLFSHVRLHGTTPREPWAYGARALRIFRAFARLRYRLVPYLYSESVVGLREGRPLARPVAFDFPDWPEAGGIEDEYLLGRAFLVAPVVPDGRTMATLPPGTWFDFWSGRRIDGPARVSRRVPLETVPIFVRQGSTVPMTRGDWDHVEPTMLRDLAVRVYGRGAPSRLDFGRYGRLDLGRPMHPRGTDHGFRWTVDRRGV
jgi:alpha-D-xyloside xylohydrolase